MFVCNSGGTVDFIHPDLFQGEFFFRREITMIIKLKDGSVKEYSAPVTAAEITKDISMGLYRNACCVSINGKIADLRTVVESDCDFEVLTFDDEDGKKAFNHTASHVMAQAVKRLYPNAKLTIGPAIENGFYYDFDVDTHFTQDDLDKIEKEMKVIIKENYPIERFELPADEAIKLMEEKGETPLSEIMKPLHFVLESQTLDKLLKELLHSRSHLFAVLDEYGGLAGVVTLEDVFEEMLGSEIMDESDSVADLRQMARQRRQALRAAGLLEQQKKEEQAEQSRA